MRPDEADYARYRLARAEETMREARLLFEHGHLDTAVSRLYYACFYAVSGLLHTEGHSAAKHSGVMALFDQHWIKPGRLPADMGRFYHRLFDRRQVSDYGTGASHERQDVESWLEQAEQFVRDVTLRANEALER